MSSKEKISVVAHHGKPILLELSSLCVYNSNLGPKEGEEEKKILFFHPSGVLMDQQIRHVGLMEAVAKFVRSFSDNDCRSMRTARNLHILLQPEPDFWFAMTLRGVQNPDAGKHDNDDIERTRDEQPQEDTYYKILTRLYKMYNLLHGQLSSDMSEQGIKNLKPRLARFFGNYFSKFTFGQYDMLHRFEAMSYLPMDRNVFLNVQNMINTLCIQFTNVKHALLLYWDLVVWNDLDLQLAQTVAQYVSGFVFPDQVDRERHAIHSSSVSAQLPQSAAHLGRFCSVGMLHSGDSDTHVASAFLTDADTDELVRYDLAIYNASGTTLCLFLQDVVGSNAELLRRLDSFLGPALTTLSSSLAEQFAKLKNPVWAHESPYVHYVYLNDSNLSKKQTLVDRTQTLQVELLKALATIDEDIRNRPDEVEIFAKVLHDCWIYGKRKFDRSLYAVITQRNADLVLAEEEIRRLYAKEFSCDAACDTGL
ncbi:vacuolar fusion protein CCZ1 homolog isoform X2 [Paramacrobiotus metropolitanus]|uniref:vacuolar fusion protein CCZ1 homolog isoform X2 n=1 Tax=Paramacrobiotus metropolitanus TaxID=2943436 RepID=UPI0024456457|nr:vacuolar fusion protein CCZ1 homolog isoform X2 [Paramacrobiotus metropolitanus]